MKMVVYLDRTSSNWAYKPILYTLQKIVDTFLYEQS